MVNTITLYSLRRCICSQVCVLCFQTPTVLVLAGCIIWCGANFVQNIDLFHKLNTMSSQEYSQPSKCTGMLQKIQRELRGEVSLSVYNHQHRFICVIQLAKCSNKAPQPQSSGFYIVFWKCCCCLEPKVGTILVVVCLLSWLGCEGQTLHVKDTVVNKVKTVMSWALKGNTLTPLYCLPASTHGNAQEKQLFIHVLHYPWIGTTRLPYN